MNTIYLERNQSSFVQQQNSSNTSEYATFAFSNKLKTFYYSAFSLMFVVGIVGNMLVIYFIGLKHRNRRTNFDVYIISLAIADLLASIFLPVVMIHDLYTLWNHWHLAGIIGCKLFIPMPHINTLVSALMLVVISLDRMRIIKQTKLSKTSRNIPTIQVIVVWIVSIAIVSPYIAVLRVEHGACRDHWKAIYRFVYYAVLQCFSCFLPIIIMIATYAVSAYTLLGKRIPGDVGHLMNEKRRKQNQKVTQMFGIIIVIFFVMTTPYMISFFIIAYNGTFKNESSMILFHVQFASYTLMGFNSAINPLIYAVRYKDISKNVKRMFTKNTTKMKRKNGVVSMTDRKNGMVSMLDRKNGVVSMLDRKCVVNADDEKSKARLWLLQDRKESDESCQGV